MQGPVNRKRLQSSARPNHCKAGDKTKPPKSLQRSVRGKNKSETTARPVAEKKAEGAGGEGIGSSNYSITQYSEYLRNY